MLYVLGGTGVGAALCFMLVKAYLDTVKKEKELLEVHSGMVLNDHSRNMKLFSIFLAVMGAVTIYLNYTFSPTEQINTAMGIVIVFAAIGSYFSMSTQNRFYYNDAGIIVEGKYIRYKSVKKVDAKRSLGKKNYTLHTFQNEEILISAKTSQFLEERLKK